MLNALELPADIHPEKNARACLKLLDQIKEGHFSCRFETSSWAMAELSQVIRDSIIALKIVRDGLSLVYFNRLKRFYVLAQDEQDELLLFLHEFPRFLRSQKVIVKTSKIEHSRINELCCKYGIETPDAAHIALAVAQRCQFLATIDRDMLETKPRIEEVRTVRPSFLCTLRQLRR